MRLEFLRPLLPVVLTINIVAREIHHRDTEGAEGARRFVLLGHY